MSPKALSRADKFQKRGILLLRSSFFPFGETTESEIKYETDAIGSNSHPMSKVLEQSGGLRSIFGVHLQSEKFKLFISGFHFESICEALTGTRGFTLYQTQLNYKQPGQTSGFSPHRDATYFHGRDGLLCDGRVIGFAILLDNVVASQGPLITAIGSHRHYTPPSSPCSYRGTEDLIHQNDFGCEPEVVFEKYETYSFIGRRFDVLAFDVRCIHFSSVNTSNRPRPILLAFFCPSSLLPSSFTGNNPYLHEKK